MIAQIIVVQDNQDLYVTRRLQYITIKALYANTIPGSCSGALNQTPDHLTTRPTCMNIQKRVSSKSNASARTSYRLSYLVTLLTLVLGSTLTSLKLSLSEYTDLLRPLPP